MFTSLIKCPVPKICDHCLMPIPDLNSIYLDPKSLGTITLFFLIERINYLMQHEKLYNKAEGLMFNKIWLKFLICLVWNWMHLKLVMNFKTGSKAF